MALIIVTGILTAGILPLFALIGFGVSLLVNIFTVVTWGYWQCVGVGFLFSCLFGGVFRLSINIKSNKEV